MWQPLLWRIIYTVGKCLNIIEMYPNITIQADL